MNWEQWKGIIERLLGFGVMYAAGKGLIPEAIGGELVAGAMMLIGAVWAWKVNTAPALEKAAEATKS